MATSTPEISLKIAMKKKSEKLTEKTKKLIQMKDGVFWRKHRCLDETTDTSQFIFLAQDTKDQDIAQGGNKCFYRLHLENIGNLVKTLEDKNNLGLYEILPANLPVKQYFDLEMERNDFDDVLMTDCLNDFFNWYISEIKEAFGIELKHEDFVILNSCRKNKLSFHVVVNTKFCFDNVRTQKDFIAYLWSRFQNPKNDKEKAIVERLTWKHRDETRFIFDKNPYGTDQNIRLINQSKRVLDESNAYILKNVTGWGVQDTFVRLYHGVGDRRILTMEEISVLVEETEKSSKTKSRSKTSTKTKMNSIASNPDFVPTGRTLFEKYKMTEDTWKKLPPYQRYLYLIPNTNQSWDIYLSIGFAIRSVGGSYNEWEEWSKLSLCSLHTKRDFSQFESEWKGLILEEDMKKLREQWESSSNGVPITEKSFLNFRLSSQQTDSKKNYDLPYLRRLAKMAKPEFFRTKMEALSRYFQLDKTNIKVLKETCEFVSQDNDNILDPAKILILYAYMGRGKTFAIKRLLNSIIETFEMPPDEKFDTDTVGAIDAFVNRIPKPPKEPIKVSKPLYESYLFLSPRQSFARFIQSEFDCDCYLDKGNFNSKKLVVSVESLLKVKNEEGKTSDFDYECIVIDECESILMQFSSTTTNGKHVEIWNKLIEHIQKAKKVIIADAFITNRTLNFLRSLHTDITMIENQTSPVKRKAEEIHPTVFAPRLIDSIKKGDKNYVCYSSVTALIKHKNIMDGVAMENEQVKEVLDNSIIYHAKVNDKVFDSLKTINESWRAAKLVMTSPSNTVGCSYSHPSLPPDINAVWMNGAPTCCVRDSFQSHMRTRHVKDKMVFCLPTPKSLMLSKGRYDLQFDVLDEYENYNKEKREIVTKLITELKRMRQDRNPEDKCDELDKILEDYNQKADIPEALREVLFFNLFEQTLSGKFYREMFYMFLEKCGYTTTNVPFEEGEQRDSDFEVKNCDDNDYEKIESISEKTSEIISEKIKRKQATEVEKRQNEKFWFNTKISVDCPNKSEIFKNFYLVSNKRTFFDNAYIESKRRIEQELENNARESGGGFELNSMTAVKLNYVKTINKKLGIKNSFICGQTFPKERVNELLEYLNTEKQNIHRTFGLKDQSTSKEPLDFKRALGLLQKMYSKWCGMKFSGVDINKHTKQYSTYETRGEDLNFFTGISVYKFEKQEIEQQE